MLPRDYSWSENALGLGATVTLAVLAVTSLGLRYVTNPVSCWTPPEFTGAMVVHVHHKCFQAAEVLVEHSPIVLPDERQQRTQVTFHQWVPFALGVAAILCLIPHVIWRMLSGLLWLDAHALVQTVADNQRHNAAGRHVMLRDCALLLQNGLKGGNWVLTAAAAGRKLLVFVVCVTQMLLVVLVFRPHLSLQAARDEFAASRISNREEDEDRDRDYNDSVPLPENFFCAVNIVQLQNVAEYLLQCTMPLAQVYNKGFAFLFYLFLLLALCCLLDSLAWAARLLLPGLRDVTLKRHLSAVNPDPQQSATVLPRFLDSLGSDGRLVLAITADHCGPLAASDLLNHLWLCYKGLPRPGPAPPYSTPVPVGSAHPPTAPPPFESAGATGGEPDAIPLLSMSQPAGQRPHEGNGAKHT